MGTKHRSAYAVKIMRTPSFIEGQEHALPVFPSAHVLCFGGLETVQDAGKGLLSGFGPDVAKADREEKFASAGVEVDFAGEGYIAIHRLCVAPGHAVISRDILPTIRIADEANGHLFPRRGTGKCQGPAVAISEKHGEAFVIAGQCVVAISKIGEMGRQEGIKAVVGERSL